MRPVFSFPAALLALLLAVPAAQATNLVNVARAGVTGDGTTINTAGIQRLIDDTARAGGGTLVFPAGRYLTGTIELRSNITLRLERDAVLLGSTEAADYRNLDPFIDGSGQPMGHALIVAVDAEHVGLEGEGTVDGQSPQLKARQKPYAIRPFLVRWVRARDVTVRGVHLINPGAWTLNFFQTSGAVIEDITIRARDLGMHNNDGINIDSSEHIRIRHVDVNSGDDALVIKSTGGKPSRDIVASDCRLSSRTNAIKLGTESYGGFEDIAVSHCTIDNTKMAGIALYQVDGSTLRNVTIGDIAMDGVAVPVSMRLGARLKTFRAGDVARTQAGHLQDILIHDVRAKNVELIGLLINGVPGHPLENITLCNVHIDLPGGGTSQAAQVQLAEKEAGYPEFDMFGRTMPAYGAYLRHVRGLLLDNVTFSPALPDARPALVRIDAITR